MANLVKLDAGGFKNVLPNVKKIHNDVNQLSREISKTLEGLDMTVAARAGMEAEIADIVKVLSVQQDKMNSVAGVIEEAAAKAEETNSWLNNVINAIQTAIGGLLGAFTGWFGIGNRAGNSDGGSRTTSVGAASGENTVTIDNNKTSYREYQKNYENVGIENGKDYSDYKVVKGFPPTKIEAQGEYDQFLQDAVDDKGNVKKVNVGCGVTSVANAYNILNPDKHKLPTDVIKEKTAEVVWEKNGLHKIGSYPKWENITSAYKAQALKDLANNVHNNNPVVVLLKSGGAPHYVTVFGLKDNCDVTNVTLSDLLVIDPGGTATSASIKTLNDLKVSQGYELMPDQMWSF